MKKFEFAIKFNEFKHLLQNTLKNLPENIRKKIFYISRKYVFDQNYTCLTIFRNIEFGSFENSKSVWNLECIYTKDVLIILLNLITNETGKNKDLCTNLIKFKE